MSGKKGNKTKVFPEQQRKWTHFQGTAALFHSDRQEESQSSGLYMLHLKHIDVSLTRLWKTFSDNQKKKMSKPDKDNQSWHNELLSILISIIKGKILKISKQTRLYVIISNSVQLSRDWSYWQSKSAPAHPWPLTRPAVWNSWPKLNN